MIIQEDGNCKLVDFGIAKEIWSPLLVGAGFEQDNAQPTAEEISSAPSTAADIYALGALSYLLLTGTQPQFPALPPSKYNTQLSEEVDKVVLNALDPEPEQRPNSAMFYLANLRESLTPLIKLDTQSTIPNLENPNTTNKSVKELKPARENTPKVTNAELPSALIELRKKVDISKRLQDERARGPSRLWLWLSLAVIALGGSLSLWWWAVSCPSGQTACGEQCVLLQKDAENCGGCGVICANKIPGSVCTDGHCKCPSNQDVCSGRCTTLLNNQAACGSCDVKCAIGAKCREGKCLCPKDQKVCANQCVNTNNDVKNCGQCGRICSHGCDRGQCRPNPRLTFPNIPNAIANRIEAGTFEMGVLQSPDKKSAKSKSTSQIEITRPFWMWQTEVTQAQFRKITGYNPSHFKRCGSQCPVENITWHDAAYFCNLLSQQQGLATCYVCKLRNRQAVTCRLKKQYALIKGTPYQACPGWRLPTEAEWEYAATGGSAHAKAPKLHQIAWYSANSRQRTQRVKRLQANAFGLYDMLGNVSEWIADHYKRNIGKSRRDPLYLSRRQQSPLLTRGGSWRTRQSLINHTYRQPVSVPLTAQNDIGFRPVRSIFTSPK
jgi:formylglycine-generating enzyme required for sulfatase activity